MARPKQYPEDRIQAQIRFMPEVHARLRALAEARMVSVAYLVEQAVLICLPPWEAETKVNTGNGKTPKRSTATKAATTLTPTKAAATKTPSKKAPAKRTVKKAAAVPA